MNLGLYKLIQTVPKDPTRKPQKMKASLAFSLIKKKNPTWKMSSTKISVDQKQNKKRVARKPKKKIHGLLRNSSAGL